MWQPPRPNEIDKKLRDDFRRLLKEYGITAQDTDPILAVMFRSFAAQIAEVYEQAAENIPLAILDELISGLGMPERRARAAQTVVRFELKEGRDAFEERTAVIGEAASREKLTFALDTVLQVSPAKIALVAIYQDQSLRLHSGTEISKELEAARPLYDAVPANLGSGPAIFMAIDLGDEEHLSRHGFYFELLPEARDLAGYLKREVWCLLDDEGGIRSEGLLRPRAGNGGVRALEWLVGDGGEPEDTTESHLLPEGFYGSRVFIFPQVPRERRFLTKIPRKMEEPLGRIFQSASGGASVRDLFARPRAWLRIGLPREAVSLSEDLVRVVLHCTTASNIEVLNQTLNFGETGVVVPVTTGGGRVRFLVKPISVKGERGAEYLAETEPSADENAGRYRIRQNKIEIDPARTARGVPDAYVNVRLLLCNGVLGNEVGAGGITAFLNRISPRTLEVRNLTKAAGGDDGETVAASKSRFAEALLSRERPVTYPDLEAMARAFEPKIRRVSVEPVLQREDDGLHRVQRVTVTLDRDSFAVPEEESEVLKRELQQALQERSLLGLEVRVAIELI
ncbi:MAG TPA: hypothetical protein VJ302_20235 [Blastocatellia bacterium]|nr:hypothetical protein [Blastocatellia bacterium]